MTTMDMGALVTNDDGAASECGDEPVRQPEGVEEVASTTNSDDVSASENVDDNALDSAASPSKTNPQEVAATTNIDDVSASENFDDNMLDSTASTSKTNPGETNTADVGDVRTEDNGGNNAAAASASAAQGEGEVKKNDRDPHKTLIFAKSLRSYGLDDDENEVVSQFNSELLVEKCCKKSTTTYDPSLDAHLVMREVIKPNDLWMNRDILKEAMDAFDKCFGTKIFASRYSLVCRYHEEYTHQRHNESGCRFHIHLKALHNQRVPGKKANSYSYKPLWSKSIKITAVNFEHGKDCRNLHHRRKTLSLSKEPRVSFSGRKRERTSEKLEGERERASQEVEMKKFRLMGQGTGEIQTNGCEATTNVDSTPKLRRFLLARHGETNYNKEHRVQGTLDESVLNYDGIAQASKLGVALGQRQSVNILAITAVNPWITRTWCSPLQRCRQTFAAVSGVCEAYGRPIPEPTIHWDLHEIHFPGWQGKLRKTVAMEDKSNWDLFKSSPHKLTLKNGFAPVVDCWERGAKNWKTIRDDAKLLQPSASVPMNIAVDGAIFIMCHGAIGQAMLLKALGLDIEMYGKSKRYAFDNCDCVEIEWMDGEDTCRRWRRIHPEETEWLSAKTARAMSGGLSCSL